MTLRAHLAVIAAAFLFGSTFVVVKDAIADAEPIPFLAARFLIAAAVLTPFARRSPRERGVAAAGAWCGTALASGYVVQTVGLQYTSAPVSAFITYLLVVLVPVMSAAWLRRWPSRPVMAGVLIATIGLFLLTGGIDAMGRGEVLTVGCAIAFAVHIILLAEYSPRFDLFRLNAVQMAVVGGLCLGPGLWFGGYGFGAKAWAAAAYTGVAASAVAMYLQTYGQRRVGPTRTSLLLMIEPVSAALLGVATGDQLGIRGAIGAGVILAGIAVAELEALRTPAVRLDPDVAP
ncbi:MAG TPA: DMT family transporter [Acidimicrobiales bacterium]|nr:DMT family transporter [Acidimicrobiales bacterium]